jgi:5'-3' exonuclease
MEVKNQHDHPRRLLLVDGHYYLYRSFFAIRGLSNDKGEPTNAIYGFVKALRRMMADVRPDLAAVVWDAGLPEHRMALLPGYKQNRDEMPDDLQVQEEPLRRTIPLMGVEGVFLEGTEADDLIASYVRKARVLGLECIVATNDKDILQLVGEGVCVYSSGSAAGGAKEGFQLLGIPEVTEKWGVPPEKIGDVLALTGDSADNIPGIPGVGVKTAAKWINQFGSLEGLLEKCALDSKIAEKVLPQRDLILKNRCMVTLDENLPLPLAIERLVIAPRFDELIATLREFGFRTLTAEFERDLQVQLSTRQDAKNDSSEHPAMAKVPDAVVKSIVQGELF